MQLTSYGFRLFKTDIVVRDGRKSQAWEYSHTGPDGTTATVLDIDRIESTLKSRMHVPERGLPLGPNARPLTASEEKERPVFQLEAVTRISSTILSAELRYGRHRDEDVALPAVNTASGNVDLTDHAPTRSYRVALFAPTTGTAGMMAVEAIARACPSAYFVKWLRRWMMDDVTTPEGTGEWRKLRAYAATDPSRLAQFVNSSSASKAVLIQRSVGPNRRPKEVRFQVEAAIYSNQSSSVTKLLQSAITSSSDDGDADADYANELADVLGASDLGQLNFDDGYVVVDTESGKQNVSPSRIPEIFTYPIGNERPLDAAFRSESHTEIVRLMSSLGATLDVSAWK